MQTSFWQQLWQDNELGWHASSANPLLVNHFNSLNLATGQRVFVPLCGKTLDIAWLLSQGLQVVGAELVESAVQQLFEELGVTPIVEDAGELRHYQAEGLDVYVGDIFALSKEQLGDVDAIYDRAAFVALPEPMRKQYSEHLIDITHNADQLLICFEYKQEVMPGPPFSNNSDDVQRHYQQNYKAKLLESIDVKGGLKGICPAVEHIWLLSKSD